MNSLLKGGLAAAFLLASLSGAAFAGNAGYVTGVRTTTAQDTKSAGTSVYDSHENFVGVVDSAGSNGSVIARVGVPLVTPVRFVVIPDSQLAVRDGHLVETAGSVAQFADASAQ